MAVLDTITSLLSSNPVLAGGIGTLAVGSAMYVLRAIPEKILTALERTFWTTVSVESLSSEYRDVDAFIEARRAKFFSRALEMKDGSLKTGFGSGWGTYKGTLFKYSKAKATQQIAPFETITVSFLTRTRGVVEAFMADSRPEEHRNSIHVSMYGAAGSAGAGAGSGVAETAAGSGRRRASQSRGSSSTSASTPASRHQSSVLAASAFQS